MGDIHVKFRLPFPPEIELEIEADCDPGCPAKMGKDPDDSCPPEPPSVSVSKVSFVFMDASGREKLAEVDSDLSEMMLSGQRKILDEYAWEKIREQDEPW